MLKSLMPCALLATSLIAPAAIAQTSEAAKEARRIPFNLSLIGPVGFAQVFDEPVVAQSSLNLLGGHVYGLEGVGIATLYNHVDHDMSGFQAASGLNIVGRRSVGFQAAGLGNFSLASFSGVQAAGLLNVAGTVNGAQLAGLYNRSNERMTGLQAAVINHANVVQSGAQTAVFNLAGDVSGAQIGVMNVGGKVKGVQLGVLNISDDVDGVPIGLFSYVRQGRLEADIQVSDSGLTTLGVNSGTQRVYSILGVSNLPKADGNHLGLNLGLGVQFPINEAIFSRMEITGGPLQENPSSAAYWTSVNTYKAMLGWKVAPRLAVKGGVSLNYTHLREGSSFRPSDNVIVESGRHQIWPAAFIGIDL